MINDADKEDERRMVCVGTEMLKTKAMLFNTLTTPNNMDSLDYI